MLHPGGAIRARLMPMTDVMRGADRMPLVWPEQPMRDVLVTITERSLGVAGVFDGDLRRNVDNLPTSCAADVMTLNPKTISIAARVGDALAVLAESRITVLFVVDTGNSVFDQEELGRPVGVILVHDFTAPGGS